MTWCRTSTITVYSRTSTHEPMGTEKYWHVRTNPLAIVLFAWRKGSSPFRAQFWYPLLLTKIRTRVKPVRRSKAGHLRIFTYLAPFLFFFVGVRVLLFVYVFISLRWCLDLRELWETRKVVRRSAEVLHCPSIWPRLSRQKRGRKMPVCGLPLALVLIVHAAATVVVDGSCFVVVSCMKLPGW